MEKKQANKFMKLKKNRDLWFLEVTGSFEKPYKSKYKDGLLYIWEKKSYNFIDIYDTSNIYGECEYEETLEFFNAIKEKK